MADRAKAPGALRHVAVRLAVDHAIDRDVGAVERHVLGVEVEDRRTQRADRLRNVDAAPEQVAGIQVDPEVVAGRIAQAQCGLDVVHQEIRVRLERDADAVLAREHGRLAPVRNGLLVPLPFQHLQHLRWPRRGDPVGNACAVAIAGAAGERHHHRHFQALGQAHGLAEHLVVALCGRLVGMQRIAVAGQRADDQAAIIDAGAEVACLVARCQQAVDIDMVCARKRAGAQFDRVQSRRLHAVEDLVQAQPGEQRGEDAEFHAEILSKTRTARCRSVIPGMARALFSTAT